MLACILGATKSSGTQCTSFETSNQCPFKSKSSRVWQHFYFLPRPFEKGHFRGKKGNHSNIFLPGCSSYLAYHGSDVTEHSSEVTEHGSYLTYHYSYLIWKTHIFSKYPLEYSYLTYHTSYLPNIPHQKCHILLNYLFEMFILYLPPFIPFWNT